MTSVSMKYMGLPLSPPTPNKVIICSPEHGMWFVAITAPGLVLTWTALALPAEQHKQNLKQ